MDLKEKAKTLKVGLVPWHLWIKSPAYLKLTPEKKIASLLTIIERKEGEIAKLKELSVACLCCDWHYESRDPYKVFKATIEHFLTHKKAWNNEQRKINKKLEERLGQIQEHTKNFPDWQEPYYESRLEQWVKVLVGLLGQNLEKPEPKKEETLK